MQQVLRVPWHQGLDCEADTGDAGTHQGARWGTTTDAATRPANEGTSDASRATSQ